LRKMKKVDWLDGPLDEAAHAEQNKQGAAS
jgi:hypothetical protein